MGRKHTQGRKPTKKSTPEMRAYWRKQYQKRKKKALGLVLIFIMGLSFMPFSVIAKENKKDKKDKAQPFSSMASIIANPGGDLYKFLRYDGVDDYVSILNDASLNVSGGDFTVEFWARSSGWTALMTNAYIVSYMNLDEVGWILGLEMSEYLGEIDYVHATFFGWDQDNFDEFWPECSTELNDVEWHHIVGRRSGAVFEVWVDGALDGTDTNAAVGNIDSNDIFTIGFDLPGVNGFSGDIDHVRFYSRDILDAEIVYSFTNKAPQNETDLELWLRFEEGTGDTAYDETANDNDGTLMPDYPSNAPEWVDETPLVSCEGPYKFLRFDGIDDYVIVSDDVSLNMTGGHMTVEAWVRIVEPGVVPHPILYKMTEDYGPTGWFLEYDPNYDNFTIRIDDVEEYAELKYTYDVNVSWHHYLFTYNDTDSGLRLWIDGVWKKTVEGDPGYPVGNYDTIGDMLIGTSPGPPPDRFTKGDIDEIRIYSRLLTQAEIEYSFVNKEPQNETDLELWLRLNDETGDTATDETDNDNDGTLMPDYPDNAPEWIDEAPVLAISIANIDAGEWVFEGKKRYEFTVEYIDVDLADIEQVGVGFTDETNQFHNVWYDRDANTLTVTSPEDGISGWLHSIEQTDTNVTAVFQIMFNTPIPDSYSVSAYGRIVDAVDSGWINGTEWNSGIIFNIYNLGGLSTLTASGMAGRVPGGDIFEIYAADTRTPILIPNEDFDVRENPINWWEWGQSEQDLLDDVDWMLWMPWRNDGITMFPTNVLPDGAAQADRSYHSYPFGFRIIDNDTSANRYMYMEKNFWRVIGASDDELVFTQFHMMNPDVGEWGDPGGGGEIRVMDRSIKEEGYAYMALQLRFDSLGYMIAYNDTAIDWVNVTAVTSFTWYNVTAVFNVSTQLVDVYVEGVLKLDDLPFVDEECTVLKTVWVGRANAGVIRNDFYLDDIRAWTNWDKDYGGLSKATMLFNQLQHWSMDFDVFIENGQEYAQGASAYPDSDYSDHGYWEFGWDVMINGTWVNDFLVARVNVSDGHISGKNNWVKYNVDWYSQGEYVKSNLLYGLFEGYSIFPGSDKDTSGFHWDIWFNQANASTIVGARVNTEYYGMSDKAVWWAVWSSLWKPMRTEVSESTVFIDLEDAGGTIHSAKDVGLVRSWVKVLRTSQAEFAYKIVNIGSLDFMVAQDTMSGIDTPPVRDTQVPDVMSGFFGSALGGIFSAALKRLSNALAGFGMGFFTMSIEFIDNIFASLGYPALVATIFDWMDSLFSYVPSLVGYGMTLIGNIFTLINISASNILTQLTSIITIWAGMYGTMTDFLTGVLTPGFNLWNDLGVSSFIQVGAILYPLWLFIMLNEKGGQAVIEHLTGVLNIASFFLNFILNVAGFFMSLLTGLIGAIRG